MQTRVGRALVSVVRCFALATLVLSTLAIGLSSTNALAQVPAGVTVQVNPATVRLTLDGEAEVIVVVTNGSNKAVKNLGVTPSLPTGVSAAPASESIQKLVAGGSFVATFTLSRTQEGALPATGLMRADFTQSKKKNDTDVSATVVQPFDIKGQEAEPIEQLAKVELKSTASVLDEFDPIELAVIVTNTSPSTVTVTRLEPHGPEQIEFKRLTKNGAIPSLHQRIFEFEMSIKSGSPIRSGEALVYVDVDFATGSGTEMRTASVSSALTVKLGVFGDSDIAQIAKIPSLLFLPGFMLLMAIVMIGKGIKWFRLSKASETIAEPTVFAFLMICASIALLWTYWLLRGRDLRSGYSFNDVLWVSVLGIAGAIVIAVGTRVVSTAWFRYVSLDEDDDPIMALKKLGRRRKGLHLPNVKIAGGGQALLYEAPRQDTSVGVAAPAICVSYRGLQPELQDKVNSYRNEGKKPGELAKVLRKAVADGRATVGWKPNPGVAKPAARVKEKLEIAETQSEVVEEC